MQSLAGIMRSCPHAVIPPLQRIHVQYTGATLTPLQMNFTQCLSLANDNKEKTERELEEAVRDRETAQAKLEEIELEKNNLQELMVAIKVSHYNDPDCIIESLCV